MITSKDVAKIVVLGDSHIADFEYHEIPQVVKVITSVVITAATRDNPNTTQVITFTTSGIS